MGGNPAGLGQRVDEAKVDWEDWRNGALDALADSLPGFLVLGVPASKVDDPVAAHI